MSAPVFTSIARDEALASLRQQGHENARRDVAHNKHPQQTRMRDLYQRKARRRSKRRLRQMMG